MSTQQVIARCPQCHHQGKYWLRSLENDEAVCHLCEAPLTLSDAIVGG